MSSVIVGSRGSFFDQRERERTSRFSLAGSLLYLTNMHTPQFLMQGKVIFHKPISVSGLEANSALDSST